MMKQTPNNPLHKRQGKNKDFQTQLQRLSEAIPQLKIILTVSVETDILRAHICRFVFELREQNPIALIKTDICEFLKLPAGYYTTIPDLFPSNI